MARTFTIPKTEIVIQPLIKESGTEVNVISVTDDGGCVMASWTFAGKGWNKVTLFDENTTPSYLQIGKWDDPDIDAKILEIISQ